MTPYGVEKVNRSYYIDIKGKLGVLVGWYYVGLPCEVVDDIWAHGRD
jgi:hypothetical protein